MNDNKFGGNVKSKFGSVQKRITPFIGNNFVWVLVLIMGVGAGIVNPTFLSSQNLLGILNANAYLGYLVVGASLVLISGNIDISFANNLIFSSIMGGRLMMKPGVEYPGVPGIPRLIPPWAIGLSWPLALVGMLGLSSLIGLINGFLVVKCRMNSLVVTIAIMFFLLGWSLVLGRGYRGMVLPEGFTYLGSAEIGPISVAVLFTVVVLAIMGVVLSRTTFGSHLYAVGGNRRAARAAGINDDRVTILAFVLCGFSSGLAGFLLMGRLATASAGMLSQTALFPAIAAAVIGGVSIYGGRGGVVGMVGGLLLMGMITNALSFAGVSSELVNVVTGVIILIAIGIDAFRRRRELRE